MNQRELFLRYVAQTSDLPLLGENVDIVRAEGVKLYDRSGKVYTDLISGISVSSVGHCHPRVVKAVQDQAQQFMHLMVYGEFNQSPQVRYAELLTGLLPAALNSVYFTTGGSEAVEGALKLAKRATGRNEIVNFRNAYHGSTQGALSVMGDEYFKNSFRPLLPGIRTLDFNRVDQLVQISTATAAVIVEPVQGEAGIRIGDKQFFKALGQRCDEVGALLIIDEIQTGFGRTGKLFAFEQLDVIPDLLLIAKGMGGGMPIGAFVARRELMQCLTNDPVLGHINTFGGNAVCVAAAQAALEVLTGEGLIGRAATIEQQVREKLKHPLIQELRICGALGAVDFCDEALNMRVIKSLIQNGLISDWFLFCNTAMRIAPPLTITDEELREAITTILRVLDNS